MPKHSELFVDHYFNDKKEEETFEEMVSSPLNERINRENPRHNTDTYGYEDKTSSLNIEGGILQNYRKLSG